MTEYNPEDNEKFGKSEGQAYVLFIANQLKPFIDKSLRTLPDSKNTFIAGSSMGGLISMWAILVAPKTFGAVGIFSPAFWTATNINFSCNELIKHYKGKLFFYAGQLESKTMITDMDNIIKTVRKKSKAKIVRTVWANGLHNEATWSAVFPSFLGLVLK